MKANNDIPRLTEMEFIASKCALQEILKEVLQDERNTKW